MSASKPRGEEHGAREHFDAVAPRYDSYKEKAAYYYTALQCSLQEVVPPGRRVLEIGCGTGDILASLRPRYGLGTDISEEMVILASRKHPELEFRVHDVSLGPPGGEHYDFVVAADVVEHLPDLERPFASMAQALAPGGRLVVTTANPAWGPILEVAERLRLKMPEGEHTWRTRAALERAARAAGLSVLAFDRLLLVPKRLPFADTINRTPVAGSLRSRFGLLQRAVFALDPAIAEPVSP